MIPMLLSNTELALVIAIPASVLVVIGILLILFFNLRKRKKTLRRITYEKTACASDGAGARFWPGGLRRPALRRPECRSFQGT